MKQTAHRPIEDAMGDYTARDRVRRHRARLAAGEAIAHVTVPNSLASDLIQCGCLHDDTTTDPRAWGDALLDYIRKKL